MKKQLVIKVGMKNIENLTIFMFFLLTAVIFLYEYNGLMFNLRLVFMLLGAILGYWRAFSGPKIYYKPVLLALSLTVCWVLCTIAQSNYTNYPPDNMLYTILYIGMSLLILRNKYSHGMTVLLYLLSSITVLYRVVFQNVNINSILLANSRNYISVLLMLSLLLYYISCHDKNKPVYVTPVILYFVLSVFASGRGGIISSGFLTVGICIHKALSIENKTLKRLLWMAVFFIILIMLLFVSSLTSSAIDNFMNTYFSAFRLKGTTDAARENLWSGFLSNNRESIMAYIFGSDTHLIRVDGNLHNSLLQAYASFGLIGFLIIIVLIIKTFIDCIKNKDSLLLILFAALILRAFTDRLFFQGYCEVLLYYFLLYWGFREKYSFRKKLQHKNQRRV